MTIVGWIQILLFCAIIVALTPLAGGYITRVFAGERTFLSVVLRPVEAAICWAGGVDAKREQHWLTYTVAMLLFHVGGFLILYVLMRTQSSLPFNPAILIPLQLQSRPAGGAARCEKNPYQQFSLRSSEPGGHPVRTPRCAGFKFPAKDDGWSAKSHRT